VDAKDDEVTLLDNKKIYLGTGNDLELYHDGSNSRINDAGTGNLQLQVGGTTKLEVTGTGVSVTGDISATGSVSGTLSPSSLDLADNEKILLGTGDDLEIFHDASDSLIKDTGTGSLKICTNALKINNAANNENLITADENGTAKLFYDDSDKLETTASGITISGNLDQNGHIYMGDNNTLFIGDGNDIQIYHDASHSYIDHGGTGNLHIRGNGADDIKIQAKNGEQSIICNHDGNVELYYDNIKKFETTSTGVNVTGGIRLGGNNAANEMDDYEEGTFTATPQNSVTLHGTIEDCFYTKVGRLVHLQGQIRVDSDNSNALLRINIPFAADNGPDSSGHAVGALRTHSHDYGSDQSYGVFVLIADGWTDMRFQYNKDNAANEAIAAQSDAYYCFSITYTAT
jgi:hypothetical protein